MDFFRTFERWLRLVVHRLEHMLLTVVCFVLFLDSVWRVMETVLGRWMNAG